MGDSNVRALEGGRGRDTILWIRGLDTITTSEEVREALLGTDAETDRHGRVQVVKMMPAYGDSQTAKVRIPSDWAKRLAAEGRIKVGIVRYVRSGRMKTFLSVIDAGSPDTS